MMYINDSETQNENKKEVEIVDNDNNKDNDVNQENKLSESQTKDDQNKEVKEKTINSSKSRSFGKKNFRYRQNSEFEEKVINISRITNVVKGGRRFSFSAIVVIGDKKGRIGQGHGKAKEVVAAIKKAVKDARKHLVTIPIVDNRTIPHIVQAKFVSSNVMLKPASKGRGIIASGAVRSVVELAGYHDIVTKSLGSSNKTNVVKATIKALQILKTEKQIFDLRSIKK